MSLPNTFENLGPLRLLHLISHKAFAIRSKRFWCKTLIPCIILLMFCSPVGFNPNHSELVDRDLSKGSLPSLFVPSEGLQAYSSSGAAQPVTFDGFYTNDSQELVIVDPSTPSQVSIHAPSGWTGNDLSGSLEYISTEFRPLRNGLLDDYHEERHILSGSPWNSEVFNVPDDWSVLKNGDSTTHPTHGGLYWY
ncbi:MAG: hypothetical protein ACW96M_02740, partial [Candidatus Thorarchaeota archaeon]